MLNLEEFLDTLYGEQDGYAYSPTKSKAAIWKTYFFRWPEERVQLIEHIESSTDRDVYISPALFSKTEATKESFKGTYHAWAEFDGDLPDSPLGPEIPEPTLKIQSSRSGYEHWYWRLDQWLTDQKAIEAITAKLTASLGGDHVWNVNRVLRPVNSRHMESGERVTALAQRSDRYSVLQFAQLRSPTKVTHDFKFTNLPTPLDVIAKYTWTKENLALFKRKTQPVGSRSSALTRLAHVCIEIGLTDGEVLALLIDADKRWGKFTNRSDQEQRLGEILSHCKAKVKPKAKLLVMNVMELLESKIQLEWAVDGLIENRGCLIISGTPGIGKTQISLRFAQAFATGSSFLKWDVAKPGKILVVSAEMKDDALKYIISPMVPPEQAPLIRQNYFVAPLGHAYYLDNPKNQKALNQVIEENEPVGVIFDSLGRAIRDINSDTAVLDAFEYIERTIQLEYGAFTWFVHHYRKGQVGNRRPKTLDDLYGNQYIGGSTTNAVNLFSAGNEIEVICAKSRLTKEWKPFFIRRTENLGFEIVRAAPSRGQKKSESKGEVDDGIFGTTAI